MDEFRVLNYGEVYINAKGKVIEGTVVIAKNPCFHPGDIRVLTAVNSEWLGHLRNVLVFPQMGPRPHPNECSGSDLDGDAYFVTWNPMVTRAGISNY